jgi:hypothetical protein
MRRCSKAPESCQKKNQGSDDHENVDHARSVSIRGGRRLRDGRRADVPAAGNHVAGIQERFDKSMHEIIELSTYVRSIDEARVNVGLIACTPTPLPKMPDGALDPRLLKRAIKTMLALNDARMIGDSEPLQESIEKCRPVGE